MATAFKPSRTLLRALRQSSHLSLRTPATSQLLKRSYFSIHHPDPAPFTETERQILSAAISHVPQYGFSEQTLKLGAKDAGYLDVTVQLFPRGVFDLINYHLVTQRLALKENVQFPEGAKLGLGAKVRTLAMARLRANADIIRQWQGV